MEQEEWRDISDYPGYQVSNLGRVRSFKWGREQILKLGQRKNGYLYVTLCKGNKPKHFLIHRLVATAFIPNLGSKRTVNHLDGDKLNNNATNLEWATQSENQQHAYDTGLAPSGEDSYQAKLTNAQVELIRDNPDGLTIKALAQQFNIPSWAISEIQIGRTYRKVGGKIRNSSYKRLPDEIRAQIRAEYVQGLQGHGTYALAKKYGCTSATIWRILHEK